MTLTLTLPAGEFIYTGRQVTFQAPCNSEGLTGIVVGSITYDIVDALGHTLVANSFHKDAMVSVIFNVGTKKAYVQNADTNAYLEGKFNEMSPNGHRHTRSEITDFPTSLPASDVPAWAKSASKPSYTASEVGASPTGHKHTKSDITDFPAIPANTETLTITYEDGTTGTLEVYKK